MSPKFGDKELFDAAELEFIAAYIEDPDAKKAYMKVRPDAKASSAKTNGHEMLHRPHVKAEINRRLRLLLDKAEITKDWINGQLRLNVLQCLTPGDTFNPNAANKALELLGKERRMFTDRHLHAVRRIDDMSDEELVEFLGGDPDNDPDDSSGAGS